MNQTVLILLITLNLINLSLSQNVCDGNLGQTIADPNRCYGFIICALSTPIYYTCPDNTIFDIDEKFCLPGSQETCQMYDDIELWCQGVFFGARPYHDFDQFYAGCIRDQSVLMRCFNNEYFDRDMNECVAGTRNVTIPTGPTMTSTQAGTTTQGGTSTASTPTTTQAGTSTATTTQAGTSTASTPTTTQAGPSTATTTQPGPSTPTTTQAGATTPTTTQTAPTATTTSSIASTTTRPFNPCDGINNG
jgi:Chitin binding Peritrophin-A domain